MADINFVQLKPAFNSGTLVASFDSALTAGSLVVVVFGILGDDDVTSVSITDNLFLGSPLELVVSDVMLGDSGSRVYIYEGIAAGGEVDFIVETDGRCQAIAFEFSNVQYGAETPSQYAGSGVFAEVPEIAPLYNRNLIVGGFIHDQTASEPMEGDFQEEQVWEWFFLGAGYLIRQNDSSSIWAGWPMDSGGEWAAVGVSWGSDDDPSGSGKGNFFFG